MSASFPWFKFTATAFGLLGLGYGLMKATVPSEEDTYNAMAPDLRRKVDANRAARLAREEAQTKADSAKPIWAATK